MADLTVSANVDTLMQAASFAAFRTSLGIDPANEATDTTCFPLFVTAATGTVTPKTNAAFAFNSFTGALDVTSLDTDTITATTVTATTLIGTVQQGVSTLVFSGNVNIGGAFTTASTFSTTGTFSSGGNFSTSSTFAVTGALSIGGAFTTSSTVSITGALSLGTAFSTSGNVLTFNGFSYTFAGVTGSVAPIASPTFTGTVTGPTIVGSTELQSVGNVVAGSTNGAAAFYFGSGIRMRKSGTSELLVQTSGDVSFATLNNTNSLFTAQITVASAVATPANGSSSARLLLGTTAAFGIYYGSGAPTGLTAAQGSLYLRSDGTGTADRMYVNNSSGSGTTWTAVATAG